MKWQRLYFRYCRPLSAANFLIKFDWEKYKELRSTMVAVKLKSDDMVANAAVQKLINEVRPDKQDAAVSEQDI